MEETVMPVRIVGFMPTPFDERGGVDASRLSALAGTIAAEGIHPAVLGGMGEYYALDRAESRDCMVAAVAGAGGAPVVAGVGWSTREAALLAADAGGAGIDALVLNPPYYAAPSPEAYAEHVRRVAEAGGIGAIVYSSRGYPMTDAHLERLVEVEGFLGVKEEHYGIEETAVRIARWGDRVEWWGVGEADGSAYARAGARTVTSSLCNVRPDLVVRAVAALVSGGEDPEAVRAVREWSTALAADRQGAPAFLTEAMHRTAGWNRSVRLPLLPSDAEGRRAVQAFLDAWARA